MFALTESMRYFLCPHYVNMQAGIESLYHLVKTSFHHNPLSGAVYLFVSRDRQQFKLLHWEKTGFVLYQKRLEEGTFELPRFKPDEGLVELSWVGFILFTEGVSLRSAKLRHRFRGDATG